MVLHAFYAAWDEAVKSKAAPKEGSYRKQIDEENSHRAHGTSSKLQLQNFAQEINNGAALSEEQKKRVDQIIEHVKAEAKAEHHDEEDHHHHHHGPMPLINTPRIIQKHGEPQPCTHAQRHCSHG